MHNCTIVFRPLVSEVGMFLWLSCRHFSNFSSCPPGLICSPVNIYGKDKDFHSTYIYMFSVLKAEKPNHRWSKVKVWALFWCHKRWFYLILVKIKIQCKWLFNLNLPLWVINGICRQRIEGKKNCKNKLWFYYLLKDLVIHV